ncbi:hypothetical protein ES332_D04G023700v1 [Gossypium tomentosum]|uniref:Uncharacterized protein n=1 Tax=Gossypium tomentosum TaxID=34277 RepID=A0A5D2L923_GOSTO|nr:hypothetical protein ES332_D04G023700v1 [Gossypium tomentosum]TYH75506.1 hypothetical protein ES332_D04G023700v1 [Gossypium tomentosum]
MHATQVDEGAQCTHEPLVWSAREPTTQAHYKYQHPNPQGLVHGQGKQQTLHNSKLAHLEEEDLTAQKKRKLNQNLDFEPNGNCPLKYPNQIGLALAGSNKRPKISSHKSILQLRRGRTMKHTRDRRRKRHTRTMTRGQIRRLNNQRWALILTVITKKHLWAKCPNCPQI